MSYLVVTKLTWIILIYSGFTQPLMVFVDQQVAQWSYLMTSELWKSL